jgi:hypothetical protein
MNKTDETLAGILKELAAKFGTTVDKLYAILIKQAFIVGIECCIVISIIVIAYSIFLKYLLKDYHKQKTKYGWDSIMEYFDEHGLAGFLTFIFTVITIGVITGCGITAANCLFNPEYYVFKNLIK